jgi:hypothetical protein
MPHPDPLPTLDLANVFFPTDLMVEPHAAARTHLKQIVAAHRPPGTATICSQTKAPESPPGLSPDQSA